VRIRIRKFWRRRRNPDDLPPAPASRRLGLAAAAVAITALLGMGLLGPHLDFLRAKRGAEQPRPCAPGQTADCIGGRMGVIVAPAASSPR
jgi:hypothetical protein